MLVELMKENVQSTFMLQNISVVRFANSNKLTLQLQSTIHLLPCPKRLIALLLPCKRKAPIC